MTTRTAPTRTVFFGSPEYALPTFRRLLSDPGIEVVTVVTQPPRPRGRSGRPEPTPVGALALEAGIPVVAPARIDRAISAQIAELQPTIGVLAASGHILPQHLLDVFPRGVLNVHASLLPRHRGASPVAAAILAGDTATGASIMLVVRELDAGPVLARAETAIGPLDTTGTLTERIASLGADALIATLHGWVNGTVSAAPQDPAQVTYAPRLAKADGVLDWTLSAHALWRQVRAFQPWPLATTSYLGEQLTVHAAWPLEHTHTARPGTVLAGDGATLDPLLGDRRALALVVCGSGSLALLRVQRAGRRAVDIETYLNGDPRFIGAHLGEAVRSAGD